MEGVISKIDAMTMEPDQRQMEMNPQESEIMKLPDEVLETIFLMLPRPDVRNVALVCRRFSEIAGREPFLFKIYASGSYDVKKIVNSCVQKMAKVKEVYPRASFEFTFYLEYELFSCSKLCLIYINYILMRLQRKINGLYKISYPFYSSLLQT